MSLDGTVSEFFFRSSIKKYMIDSLTTIEGILVVFDKTILYDDISSYDVDEWIVVNFGIFDRDLIARNIIDINCCTRKDAEGIALSKLTDKVFDYLTDTTQTDTLRRIALFDSTDADPDNWTEISKMLVLKILEGKQNTTADQTKVKTFSTVLSWGAIV